MNPFVSDIDAEDTERGEKIDTNPFIVPDATILDAPPLENRRATDSTAVKSTIHAEVKCASSRNAPDREDIPITTVESFLKLPTAETSSSNVSCRPSPGQNLGDRSGEY